MHICIFDEQFYDYDVGRLTLDFFLALTRLAFKPVLHSVSLGPCAYVVRRYSVSTHLPIYISIYIPSYRVGR